MSNVKQFILIYSVIFYIIFPIYSGSYANELMNNENSRQDFLFFPESRISIAPSVVHHQEHNLTLTRYFSFDALRYGPITLSFSAYEMFQYMEENSDLRLKSIYYNMEYMNLRFDSSFGRGSLFIDHRCMNYADIYEPPPRLRWYGYGAAWESNGIMIGEKDVGHGLCIFNSDDYLNFSVSARKRIYTEYYPYDYITDLMLRFDYYLTPRIIPYISGKGEIFFSDKIEWNRTAELGMRFVYGNTDIIPYMEYAYITDRVISDTGRKSMYSTGIRIEASLSEDNPFKQSSPYQKRTISFSPELHLLGSYSKYINDSERNYRSDILLAFDFLRIKSFSLFCNSSFIHSSQLEQSGLYPRYIDYYNEAGLTVHIKKIFLLEPLCRYSGYGEGNTIDAGKYSYHITGIRLRSTGLKPGYTNSRINSRPSGSFSILLNTEFEFFAGWINGNNSEKNSYSVEGTIREDLFSYESNVQYISLNACLKKGELPESEKTVKEIKSECGIRFNNNLVLMLFYQYIYREPENDNYDINSKYHLAGVRIDI